MDGLAGVKVPQGLARLAVYRFEFGCIVSKEYQTGGGGHGAAPGVTVSHLWVPPSHLERGRIHCQQNLPSGLRGDALSAGIVISATGAIGLMFAAGEVHVAALESEEVEKAAVGIVGGRIPIRRSLHSRADLDAFGRRLNTGEHRTASFIDTARPVQQFREARGAEIPPIGAIQDVEESVAIGFEQEALQLSVPSHVRQNGRFGGVVIEQIVRGELEMPFKPARVRLERQDAVRVKIIARTSVTHKVWSG